MSKKVLLCVGVLILSLACLFLAGNKLAVADSPNEWIRVLKSNVYIYSRDNYSANNRLFKPPLGYYLKVAGEKGNYYAVVVYDTISPSYSVKGYVLKADFSKKSSVALPIYPKITLTADNLYPSAHSESRLPVSGEGVFYGEYGEGEEKMYYVRVGGVYGYVSANEIEIEVPKHPLELPSVQETSVEEKLNAIVENKNNMWAIGLFVGIVLCFSVLLVWTLNRGK